MTLDRSAAIRAALASFGVYFLPVIGPHAFTLLGQMVVLAAVSNSEREALWRAADIGVALLLQLAAFVLFYFFFRKPGVFRAVLLLLSAPVLFWCAEVAFLYAIPSLFLIERETAQETGNWTESCSAADASMVAIRMPLRSTSEPASEILVQTSQGKYGVMKIPGCEVSLLALPEAKVQPGGRVDFMISVTDILPGAGLLFQKHETQSGKDTWWYLRNGEAVLVPMRAANVFPVLADDGESIGWIETAPNTGPPVLERVMLRRIAALEPDTQIDLSPLGPATYTLMNIDVKRREVLLSRNDGFAVVGYDGGLHMSIPKPDAVRPHPQTYLKLPNGGVGWDAYPDRDPYRIAWALPAGSGISRVLKGRLINSVAVSPSGNLIAVSLSTGLNIGRIQDEVYVLRAGDGEAVFRRYLPMYTRTPVFFPSDDLFAYTTGGMTVLARVPVAVK